MADLLIKRQRLKSQDTVLIYIHTHSCRGALSHGLWLLDHFHSNKNSNLMLPQSLNSKRRRGLPRPWVLSPRDIHKVTVTVTVGSDFTYKQGCYLRVPLCQSVPFDPDVTVRLPFGTLWAVAHCELWHTVSCELWLIQLSGSLCWHKMFMNTTDTHTHTHQISYTGISVGIDLSVGVRPIWHTSQGIWHTENP